MVRPVHKHRLELAHMEDGAVECRACLREFSGQTYRCRLCKAYFHKDCANLELKIKTFFHPCPLLLQVSLDFTCNFCFKTRPSVYRYRCSDCDFNMDVECAHQALSYVAASEGERGQIPHCCHPHPLQPLLFETQTNLLCRVCNMLFSSLPTWGCQPCNFYLHKSCLDFLSQKIKINIQSEMTSWVLMTSRLSRCIDCKQTIYSNLVFRRSKKFEHLCIGCCLVRKMVGESCSQVINLFFHPCPLTLAFSPCSTCSACFQSHHNYYFYHCKPCNFFLNFDCFQQCILNWEANQIQHFCHWHPLKYFGDAIDGKYFCNLCESSCSEPFYGCSQCQFYTHKSCKDILPQKDNHPFLNQTIVLLPAISFDCISCKRLCSRLAFRSIQSKQKFCVRCILWPEYEFDEPERFISIHHHHPLTSGDINEGLCCMCGKHYSASTYHRKRCKIFFHKSCATLPSELQNYTIHPHHLLTLTYDSPNSTQQVNCNLCFKTLPIFYDGFYRCKECNFHLDTRCASLLSSIAYQTHPHLLCLVEILYDQQNCHLCGSSCEGFPSLRCATCDFTLHLLCGPLPSTIKHASHIHPLAIQDYYVEDNTSDEFACHVCEKKRDPRRRIYRCLEGCLMTCEVDCVLSEVISSLRDERGVIKLETPYPRIASKMITRDSIFKEISYANERDKDEKIKKYVFSIKKVCKLANVDSSFWTNEIFGNEALEEDTQKHQHNEERTENQLEFPRNSQDLAVEILSPLQDEVMYSYSRKAFERFTKLLEMDTWFIQREHIYWQHDGSSMLGAYSLPEVLNSVYEELIEKYDAFGPAWNTIGYHWRRYHVFKVCSILHDMRMTKVVDVQKERIQRWLRTLKKIKGIGKDRVFKLDFLIEHVRQLGRAHFIVQARHIVDTKSSQLRKEKDELSARREELIKELKEIETKLQENEKERKKHNAYKAAGSSELKREYCNAVEIKWRPCFQLSTDNSRKE